LIHLSASAAAFLKEIDDWLRSLPVASVTRNHYRGLAVLAFNFAARNGYAVSNPAEDAAKARVVGEAPGILTVTEAARASSNDSRKPSTGVTSVFMRYNGLDAGMVVYL
jgi:hypothetical protein